MHGFQFRMGIAIVLFFYTSNYHFLSPPPHAYIGPYSSVMCVLYTQRHARDDRYLLHRLLVRTFTVYTRCILAHTHTRTATIGAITLYFVRYTNTHIHSTARDRDQLINIMLSCETFILVSIARDLRRILNFVPSIFHCSFFSVQITTIKKKRGERFYFYKSKLLQRGTITGVTNSKRF